jgi:hypothetical protein
MHENQHTTKSSCPDGMYGIIDTEVDKKPSGAKYDYCVGRSQITGDDGVTKCYYDTMVYFSFSLPVLGDLFRFKIPGQTAGMRYVNDDYWKQCEN